MKLTIGVILGIVAFGTIFDVYTLIANGYTTTMSYVLYQAAKAYPIIPFISGVLVGHILWENRAARVPPNPGKST